MIDAPEKIWIDQGDCPYFYEESELTEAGSPVTEYVRADLAALSALEPSAARELSMEEVKTSGATDVRGLIKTYANAAFEQQGKDIPKYIWHLHFEEFATAIRALSSPDHADAGKVEGEGWLPIESAPKDGTEIIYLTKYGSIGFCRYAVDNINDWFGWWDLQADDEVYPKHWLSRSALPSALSEGAE